ncbi:MAG: four helix bundle protein [Rubricoccaceae bacterium]|nr:four helix bundle protein [Rubricoccaceae bacterium]
MSKTNFENLEVYQLAEQLADIVWSVAVRWDGLAENTVARQIVRAADSVGANLAEGTGRASFKDNLRFISFARGSLYEVKHFLRRAHRRDLLSREQVDEIKPLLDELLPRLNAYRRSILQMSKNN